MIAKLTVAAGAFIVTVVVAASSAFIAYRQGFVNGLGVAERAAAARLRRDVEIASALRLEECPHALRLLDMEIDNVVLVLHGVAQQNVGVMSVLASGEADSARGLGAAKRYRSVVPSPGPGARQVEEALRGVTLDRAALPTPNLAALLEHRGK